LDEHDKYLIEKIKNLYVENKLSEANLKNFLDKVIEERVAK